MNDFLSEIRKFSTRGIISELSKISIDMLKNGKHFSNLKLLCRHKGVLRYVDVLLTAWDITSIEFLSVKYSNDFRGSHKKIELAVLVNSYRGYENKEQSLPLKKVGTDKIFMMLLGMTSEQFIFQERWRIFEKFNRDYHILWAAKNYRHRQKLDVNAITSELFDFSVDDYIAVLLTVFWLCSQNPEPLTAPEKLYKKKDATVLTKDNITKFVEYYSCSYDDLRESPLGRQLLYSKPFIKVSSGVCLSSSLFLVLMIVGNGLYWLTRDYYMKQKSNYFINAFGELFEDYIDELISKYCDEEKCYKIPEGKDKSADYFFDLGDLFMLVECKTSLLALNAKQQVPNIDNVNRFYERTIKESYKQLNSSYSEFAPSNNVPIVKVILLYDEFSNTNIIEEAVPEIFEKDRLCYVMTIHEFEILLYAHKHNPTKRDEFITQILENSKRDKKLPIGSVLEAVSLHLDNPHFEGDMNYFSKLIEYLGIQLRDEQIYHSDLNSPAGI